MTRTAVIRIALGVMLFGYWMSMFVGTHLPRIPSALAEQSDKVLHCCAYAGLVVLLVTWRTSLRPQTWRAVLLLWVIIGCYGAFDEITQPLVGRHMDFEDWIADMIGAAIGLAVAWPVSSRVLKGLVPKPA